MKYLRKFNENNSELIQELDKYGIVNYTINSVRYIDVNGNVDLSYKGLTEIPFKFGKVTGDFYCFGNNLTSLEGCPKEIGVDFSCSSNKLTDLIGGPQEVGGDYYCYNNKLTSLEGCAGDIGGSLCCDDNNLTSLDCSSVINGDIYCISNKFKEEPEFFGICDGKIIWK